VVEPNRSKDSKQSFKAETRFLDELLLDQGLEWTIAAGLISSYIEMKDDFIVPITSYYYI
jgi:hypothetical protein